MDDKTRYEQGMKVRREVLGDAWVDKSEKGKTDFNQDWVDFIARTAWGDIWSRPGLDLKTKTLICVISDTAQARWPELAIHLRMARRQGWTEDELSEALMHLCGYIGLPSVREAMLTAKEVFEELRKEG